MNEGAPKSEGNVELTAQIEALNKEAGQITEDLKKVELSELTQAELDRIDSKIDMVRSGIMIILGSGVLVANMAMTNNKDFIDGMGIGGFALSLTTIGGGLYNLILDNQRFKTAIAKIKELRRE